MTWPQVALSKFESLSKTHQIFKLFETRRVQYGHRYLRFVCLIFYICDLGSCHFHDPPIRGTWGKVSHLFFLASWRRNHEDLTRAPLGYFYNAPVWGGGAISSPPSDLRNYCTESKNSSGIWKPWKNCWRKTIFIDQSREWRHRSGQSQNLRHFGLGEIGEQNCDVKHKQRQLIGMDSVYDICKYHLLCFATIIEVKVMSGHRVKKV